MVFTDPFGLRKATPEELEAFLQNPEVRAVQDVVLKLTHTRKSRKAAQN